MATVILSEEETTKWFLDADYRKTISNSVNQLAGDLGGNGVNLKGESRGTITNLSTDNAFSYAPSECDLLDKLALKQVKLPEVSFTAEELHAILHED